MPQSLAGVFIHLVFSTKNRHPYLADENVRRELHRYLGGICNGMDCPVMCVGGVADHVHLLLSLSRTMTIADVAKEIKRDSTRWLRKSGKVDAQFQWQAGYGAFSIGRSQVETLRRYIENQEHHHRKTSFQDEYRALLTKYGIAWDENFVWD